MMDKEEMEPMMEKKEQKEDIQEESSSCCACCTTKCMIITGCAFVIYAFVAKIFTLYIIGTNKYFDPVYLWVYIFLVLALLVSVVGVCYYLFAQDSKETRAVVPWTFLIAAVASFLICIWIICYIFFIYEKNEVYVTWPDRDGDMKQKSGDEDTPK